MDIREFDALPLQKAKSAFSLEGWQFEIKYDGFRGLCFVDQDGSVLVSRNEYEFIRFSLLSEGVKSDLIVDEAVLDGEIVCLDREGKAQFYDLMFAKEEPVYAAFDLIWLAGEDLRDLPLSERQAMLRDIVADTASHTLVVDSVRQHGEALFEAVCGEDVEGIVAKPVDSPYRLIHGKSPWVKIKNPNYSQSNNRDRLFRR